MFKFRIFVLFFSVFLIFSLWWGIISTFLSFLKHGCLLGMFVIAALRSANPLSGLSQGQLVACCFSHFCEIFLFILWIFFFLTKGYFRSFVPSLILIPSFSGACCYFCLLIYSFNNLIGLFDLSPFLPQCTVSDVSCQRALPWACTLLLEWL